MYDDKLLTPSHIASAVYHTTFQYQLVALSRVGDKSANDGCDKTASAFRNVSAVNRRESVVVGVCDKTTVVVICECEGQSERRKL
jgi:hypothetical protein